jgi:hypothetical protein
MGLFSMIMIYKCSNHYGNYVIFIQKPIRIDDLSNKVMEIISKESAIQPHKTHPEKE